MILLSLMGEQPIPNLMPLWQYPQRFTITRFAATCTTLKTAQNLHTAIARDPQLKHLQVEAPLTLEAYDIQQARIQISTALNAYQAAGQEVCLNLTGGTKVMVMAAMQAAYGTGVPMLYVTTEQSQMIHFRSDGSENGRDPIAVQISVEQYLWPHGLEVSDNPNFDPAGPRSDIRPRKEGDDLEETVERLARESGFFDDVRRGVYIRKQDERGIVKNELDVVATRNGQLVVCSCKSGHVTNETIYELSSLSRRESAGIYCGKVLACTRENLPEAVIDRARASGVRLAFGENLSMVAEQMKKSLR